MLGPVSTKVAAPESVDELKRRAGEAAIFVDPERLAINPQCGFANTVAGNPLAEADMRAKPRSVAEASRAIRGAAPPAEKLPGERRDLRGEEFLHFQSHFFRNRDRAHGIERYHRNLVAGAKAVFSGHMAAYGQFQ